MEKFNFIFTLGKQFHKLFQSDFLSIDDSIWDVFWRINKMMVLPFPTYLIGLLKCPRFNDFYIL